ncbi:MAG TPA: PhnD/SsuA/transferrin family substrate-binding protein [Polyangia bacterium]|jgi:ABC-type phosphate/phosphonate transport system substrate-binding protein
MKRVVAIAILGLSGTSFAGGRDFIAEHAGAGANAQNAQPYIDQFLRIAESMAGWPANSAKGQWVDDMKAAEAAIAEHKPGFAILDPEVFFELRKKEALEPIAEVKGKTFNKGHYSLVVKDAALKSLADLKGKKVSSNHFASPKYVSKVGFDGKTDVEKDFVMVKASAPSKPLKDVEAGRADAALIDDEQLAAMKEIAPDLKVIWTSAALPPTPVVAFTKNSTPADRAAFEKALPKLCADAKGKPVCESMFIDTFAPVDKNAFAAAEKKYDKIGTSKSSAEK